jgi:hypothetical protein
VQRDASLLRSPQPRVSVTVTSHTFHESGLSASGIADDQNADARGGVAHLNGTVTSSF